MQIRRFDVQHPPEVQSRVTRSSAEQTADGAVNTNLSRVEQSGSRTETDSQIAPLLQRFSNEPAIRTSAVEAAREKVSSGFFETRDSAEQLAATDLRYDYF